MKQQQFLNSMYTPNLSYTYPGKLNLELIEPITINSPALSDFFRIVQGIRCGEYVHLIQPLSTVITKGSNVCEPTYTESGSITDRQLITAPFEVNLEYCKKEFIATCTALADDPAFIGDGLDGYELSSKFMNIIFKQVTDAMRRDIFKVMFLGQSAYDASSIYSAIDGVFTKFFDGAASYCIKPVDNTLPNQHNSILGTNEAVNSLRKAWGGAQIQLKQLDASQKQMWVTGSVWENYYDSLINNCCVEGSWKAGQDGITRLYYRGIELVPLWLLDDELENNASNPYYDIIRHFIVYTAKNNHIMGVERSADLNKLTSCYDCYRKTTVIQAEMRFGYQYAECNLISWAK